MSTGAERAGKYTATLTVTDPDGLHSTNGETTLVDPMDDSSRAQIALRPAAPGSLPQPRT